MRPSPYSVVLSCWCLAASLAAQEAQSNFGQARTRELAELGRLPTARDVVVRDFVNFPRHRLPLPKGTADVALDVRCSSYDPLGGHEAYVQIGYTTAPLGDRSLAEPCSVALVVDVSGSMADAGKMTAVQQGLRAFVDRLRRDDEVALITFSTEARVDEPRRPRGDGRWLHDAIARLTPDGSTNLHAGLMLGIAQLTKGDDGRRSRRVVILTDGIANHGVTEPDRIVADAVQRAETTIDISTIGVGENLDVPLLQRIAERTRGLFHFVADTTDVQKVFVQEADALLTPIARRPHVVVDLPSCLEPLQVFDERLRIRGSRIEGDLPDLNAGVTGVVMVRCRARGAAIEGEGRGTIAARIEFDSVNARRRTSVDAAEEITTGPSLDRGRLPDLEISKNAAIAVLAQGLADMAASCEAKRWADADRSLQRAVDDARRLFPSTDDADVQRVREIADGHARTLRRYVDRFRDY